MVSVDEDQLVQTKAPERALPPQVDQLKFLSPDQPALLDCQVLGAGDHNNVWRVRHAGKDLVVRLPKDEPHSTSFYHAEFFNQFCAYHLGLAPKIWAEDPRSGLLVSEYLNGDTVKRKDFEDPVFCQTLVRAMRLLHDSEQWFLYQHDYLGSISKKIQRVIHTDFVELPGTLYKMTLLAERCRLRLMQEPINLSPIHADLALKNIIKTEQGLRFIDWEVSGMGDRLEELAFVLFSSDMSPDAAMDFMKLYFVGYQFEPIEAAIAKTILYWLLHIYSWIVEHEKRAERAQDPAYDLQCRNARVEEFRDLLQSPCIVESIKNFGLSGK